jgi:integrase
MPIWKRFDGRKVKRGDKNYDRGTWIAEGKVAGQHYKKALPRETVKTAEQARAQDDLIRQSLRSGEFVFLTDKTKFSEFVDTEYLPFAKEENESYETKVFETNPLKQFFKDVPLRSFTPQSCEKYKNWRKVQSKRCQKCAFGHKHDCRPEPVSPSTVNREMTTLSAILSRAVFLGKIKDNPAQLVKKLQEPESRERFLTFAEKERLLQETSKHYLLHFSVLLGILTGWRSGQIMSLRKIDIEDETRTIRISKSKGRASRRVTVGDHVWAILRHLAEHTEGDYLFYNRQTGTRFLSFKRKWGEALDAAGIKDLRFHDLRRTFATDMHREGASDLTIQSSLGHSSIQMTAIYARSDNEMLRRSLNAVADGLNLNLDGIIENENLM